MTAKLIEVINLRCTTDEKSRWKKLAQESGMNLNEWIRATIHERETEEDLKRIIYTPRIDRSLEDIRKGLQAPDFEALMVFFGGSPAQALETWCRHKAVMKPGKRDWYLNAIYQIKQIA